MSAAQPTVTKSGRYEVGIHAAEPRGWFEHEKFGDEAGGGLWFEKAGDKLRLIDYDGMAYLPLDVIKGLRNMGAIVPRDFE
jgi:hypothetical protein